MSAQPYHKRFHSDALSGMMPLTLEERGAYQTVLDLIYDRGGPIHDNERLLAGYMNCSIRKWRSLRSSLLEKGKIYVTDEGMISNARADFELENYAKTSRKRAENGASGGRTKAENARKPAELRQNDVAGLEKSSTILETRNQNTVSNDTGVPPNEVKEIFDIAVRLLTGSGMSEANSRKLVGRWRKDFGDSNVLQALIDARNRGPTEPAAYIRRWLDNRSRPQANDFRTAMKRKYAGQ